MIKYLILIILALQTKRDFPPCTVKAIVDIKKTSTGAELVLKTLTSTCAY